MNSFTLRIYRFYNNLKNKASKSDIGVKTFITAAEQTFAELFWIGQNQKQFSDVIENLI